MTAAGSEPSIAGQEAGPDAARLLARSLAWDNHSCMPLRVTDDAFLPQLERYKAAGFDVVSLNVGFGDHGVEQHVRVLAHFRNWLSRHQDGYQLIETVDDIGAARSRGKLAITFDIEGGNALGEQVSLVGLYYSLGVRWMLMAYNSNNALGGGCHGEDGGLTAFGREVLDEMDRVGMVACCSHTGLKTALEVMEYSSRPVIYSHSNPSAVYSHPRNIPDHAMLACAATGGVVGLNGIGIFLGEAEDLVEPLARHIDHVVQIIGARHVGLGLDYVFDQAELIEQFEEMKASFPAGFGYGSGLRMIAPEQIGAVIERLLRLGYRDDDVAGILGGNWLRIAREVWRPVTR